MQKHFIFGVLTVMMVISAATNAQTIESKVKKAMTFYDSLAIEKIKQTPTEELSGLMDFFKKDRAAFKDSARAFLVRDSIALSKGNDDLQKLAEQNFKDLIGITHENMKKYMTYADSTTSVLIKDRKIVEKKGKPVSLKEMTSEELRIALKGYDSFSSGYTLKSVLKENKGNTFQIIEKIAQTSYTGESFANTSLISAGINTSTTTVYTFYRELEPKKVSVVKVIIKQ